MATVVAASRPAVSTDRIFYTGMALLTTLIVAVGFSPTFYLRDVTMPPLSGLLFLHGVVYTAWMALLITQTTLVAANRRAWHRTLGGFGVVLALAMIVIGTMAAVDLYHRGVVPVKGLDPRTFFLIPMRDVVMFTILVGGAVWFRRNPEAHKRLMLLATISIVDAAIARFPLSIMAFGPPVFYAFQDLLIVIGMLYDKVTRGHVHKAYWWGGGLLVLTQPLGLILANSPPWLAFVEAILGK